ncbi:methionine adenosyltransferase 2 subunit beta-like isoform X2 [Mya arenaria]|uniref:methionine adenosyltransferase 2 subunit beta-like isoform X2 n=1 Tax=Mya arenaria TaxID=6604 RepID=UPI0022E1166E|nr:methionine adenosyltransferase 2 subunit beta-like isoform X2 [Mya arenaria]
MSKRVMITGASGLLGRAIYREFKSDSSWDVCGLAFSRTSGDLIKVNITDEEAVKDAVQKFKPEVVIHSAAEKNVDVFEKDPETARKKNILATRYICQAAEQIGAWVVFISTDYVFDGTSPPYKVTDAPNPLNLYGESKVEGEKITLEVNRDNCVLRVPILYGDIERLDESAVTVLFLKVKDTSNQTKMCDLQRRFPTHCKDVAFVLRELAERRTKRISQDQAERRGHRMHRWTAAGWSSWGL